MKAVALTRYLPISDPDSLQDFDLPAPAAPTGRDLLVRVKAVSVNPVDTKVRSPKEAVEKAPRILGWDAAGVVEAGGEGVSSFRPGDEVYYAGSVTRAGSNAELQLVDERLVALKPASLSFAEAAALPLTAITAWEALFEQLQYDPQGGHRGRVVLILGGGGGVGSIAIQLAKWAGLTVVTTSSRAETAAWCRELGADHILDHRQPLRPQLEKLGFPFVDGIANFVNTDSYWKITADLIRPHGSICSIVENAKPIDLGDLKSKSATFSWEFMFSRAMFQTSDMDTQGELLKQVAALIDAGKLRGTAKETLRPINAANLRAAHAKLESGTMIGKLALEGWE